MYPKLTNLFRPHADLSRGSVCAMRRTAALLVSATLASAALPAAAEVDTVRVAYQPGLTYLPFHVMRNQQLIEKEAAERGLEDLTVQWNTYSSGAAMNDALLSGNLDFAAVGTPPLITIWDRTRGNVDVRGVAAFSAVPQYLVTTNPDVKTIEDFTDQDRIALPAVKVSLQATELQMAAAQAFGPENAEQLDDITVSMAHPDAVVALLSEDSEITAHFTNPPFQYQELQDPRVHRVLSSFDILGGPTTNGVVAATSEFREENPTVYEAFIAALDEAMEYIEADTDRAAEIYIEETNSNLERDFIADILSRDDTVFSSTPHYTMRFAEFMHDAGRIDNRPENWKDLFFADIHDRDGS